MKVFYKNSNSTLSCEFGIESSIESGVLIESSIESDIESNIKSSIESSAKEAPFWLIFGGFGAHFSHFVPFFRDFALVFDYREFNFLEIGFVLEKILQSLENGRRVRILGFSMGVWAASELASVVNSNKLARNLNSFGFEKSGIESKNIESESTQKAEFSALLAAFMNSPKIALNGTEFGINDSFGISPRIFLLTAKKFDLQSFKSALFGEFGAFSENFIFASQDELKDELNSLYNKIFKQNTKQDFNAVLSWDLALISKNDLVFPKEAQIKFWQEICNGKILDQNIDFDIESIKDLNLDSMQKKPIIIYLDLPHFAFFKLELQSL